MSLKPLSWFLSNERKGHWAGTSIQHFAVTDLSEVNELGRIILRLLDEGKINL
jgi:hypothetical protein